MTKSHIGTAILHCQLVKLCIFCNLELVLIILAVHCGIECWTLNILGQVTDDKIVAVKCDNPSIRHKTIITTINVNMQMQ